MSGPAFGFSAGDFIAAVGLLVSVTNALKDTGGASDEYRSLVRELRLLERVLKQPHVRQGAQGVFSADITQQTDLTLDTLSGFLETISKFDAKLGPQAASGWHHGVARKTQWAVAYAKEVEKLRVKLGTHLTELNMLLQLYASARVQALATTLAEVPSAIQAQGRQILTWQQDTSTKIDNLDSDIQSLGTSQEAVLNQQHSVVLAQFQATRDDIQQGNGRIAALGGSMEAQTQQLAGLSQDVRSYHTTIGTRVQEASQGMELLSRKSDLILHAISKPHRNNNRERQMMNRDDQDEVLVLLFRLLRAVAKSMGDLFIKAGLLLPFVLSAVETLTNTVRREPYLLAEDSINYTDMRGRKYTMQYEYFQQWSKFERFFINQAHELVNGLEERPAPFRVKGRIFLKLVSSRGSYILPLESDNQWEVAPGDAFSAKLTLTNRVWHHPRGEVTRTRSYVFVLSLLPPEGTNDPWLSQLGPRE